MWMDGCLESDLPANQPLHEVPIIVRYLHSKCWRKRYRLPPKKQDGYLIIIRWFINRYRDNVGTSGIRN